VKATNEEEHGEAAPTKFSAVPISPENNPVTLAPATAAPVTPGKINPALAAIKTPHRDLAGHLQESEKNYYV
jgi:hypothetical protein